MLARAIHREYFLLHCLKKEIATAKELDLRQLGKVLIFRDRHSPIIYRCHYKSKVEDIYAKLYNGGKNRLPPLPCLQNKKLKTRILHSLCVEQ